MHLINNLYSVKEGCIAMSNITSKNPIRLIVSDIEGCLSEGKGIPLDLSSLSSLQAYNRQAQVQAVVPLTLCTGRSQPFVEAFCQILGVFMPCICENGAFLYDPVRDVTLRNPAITERHMDAQRELVRRLDGEIAKQYPHRREPGKDICISLNPDAPKDRYASEVSRLYEQVRKLIDMSLFTVTHSSSAVDITPWGIDKASGLRFLSEIVYISLEDMAGIGDTLGDLPFLEITGLSAAPSNCSPCILDKVHYVSGKSSAAGVLDIIGWVNNQRKRKDMLYPDREEYIP